MLELELDGAIGGGGDGDGGGGGGGGLGEHGVGVGDVVRVGEQPRGGERKGQRAHMDGRGVEGVVVRVGRGVQVAVGDGEGKGQEEGLGGRLWV